MIAKNTLLQIISFYGLLAVILLVYWAGLEGPFLFDDYANLNTLGKIGGITSMENFWFFVFGSQTSPTGRPVAMLSFLLNDTGWPSDPRSFKYTNLLIHVLNSTLLFWLLTKLTRVGAPNSRHNYWVAFLACAIWALHPFNISTTLYPVQRMTLLSATFTLASMIGYLYGRLMLADRRLYMRAYTTMTVSLISGGTLAILSKENGALLPLFIFTMELTVLSSFRPGLNRIWAWIFLWLPSVLIVLYVFKAVWAGQLFNDLANKPFSIAQRLLTEPRILFEYLYYWYFPRVNTPGLLTQDHVISTNLFNPVTTFTAIANLVLLIVLSLRFRKKYIYPSLACLFFFAGHIIESTAIPLELYFEHRNYLPGIFLALPIAYVTIHLSWLGHFRILIGLIIVLIISAMTYQLSHVWSDEKALALNWAESNPKSQRAQRYAAIVSIKHGQPELALDILTHAKSNLPNRAAIQLHWLTIACQYRVITDKEKLYTLSLMENGYFSFRNELMLRSFLETITDKNCNAGGYDFVMDIISSLMKNKRAREHAPYRLQLYHIRGLLHLRANLFKEAIDDFQSSLRQSPGIDAALLQVSLLASRRQYGYALDHIHFIRNNILNPSTTHQGSIISDAGKELLRLEKQIISDKQQSDNTPSR